MNLGIDSVLSFSPVDPDLYEVAFSPKDGEKWELPVIGFAVVVTYGGSGGEASETEIYPVVIDGESQPCTIWLYLENWGPESRPVWVLRRKAQG